jgi:hypothetical protein
LGIVRRYCLESIRPKKAEKLMTSSGKIDTTKDYTVQNKLMLKPSYFFLPDGLSPDFAMSRNNDGQRGGGREPGRLIIKNLHLVCSGRRIVSGWATMPSLFTPAKSEG